MNEILGAVWLTVKCGVNRTKALRLLDEYQSFERIYHLEGNELAALTYLSDAEMLRMADKQTDDVALHCQALGKHAVTLLPITDERYPQQLRGIDSPPVLLYCRGKFIDCNDRLCIGVVGNRKASEYGLSAAKRLAGEMAAEGAIIISGMAEGVDGAAHEGALAAGMPTVAVLGCGVNLVYPSFHARLMKRIMETGMVVSEYPLNSQAEPWHFPERNRIISGLSQGVVVIEAAIRSGSLITARLASEQGRDVFAVPGNIDSVKSAGPNHLIKDGAGVVTCAEDVVGQYRDQFVGRLMTPNIPVESADVEIIPERTVPEEPAPPDKLPDDAGERIVAVLTDTPMHIDRIAERAGLDMAQLNSNLLLLELAGRIVSYPGGQYARAQKAD